MSGTVGQPSVVVVEEEPGLQHLIRELLESTDIDVSVTLTSLAEAVGFAEEQSPLDLVICDLDLPDSRGVATVRTLRTYMPGVAMVVLTGDPEVGPEAVNCGADDAVARDSVLQDLTAAVRHSVASHAGHMLAPVLERAQAFEESAIPQVAIDAAGNIRRGNRAFRTLTGKFGQPGRPIHRLFATKALPHTGATVALSGPLRGVLVDLQVEDRADGGGKTLGFLRPSAASSASLLLVEGDPAQRALAASLLQGLGHEVVAVATAFDALELLTEADVAIDVVVADLDGAESAGHAPLDALLEAASRPLVVFSGVADPGLAVHCLERGASAYVNKNDGIAALHREILRAGTSWPRDRPGTPVARTESGAARDLSGLLQQTLLLLATETVHAGWAVVELRRGRWVVTEAAGTVPTILEAGSTHPVVRGLCRRIVDRAGPGWVAHLDGRTAVGEELWLAGAGASWARR